MAEWDKKISFDTWGSIDELSPDNRAFARAVRQGVFDRLTPSELNAWNHLSRLDKSTALLPWYDGRSVTAISGAVGYLKAIIYGRSEQLGIGDYFYLQQMTQIT